MISPQHILTIRINDSKVTLNRLINWLEENCGKWSRDWKLVVERDYYLVVIRTEHHVEMFRNRWGHLLDLQYQCQEPSKKYIKHAPEQSACQQVEIKSKQESFEAKRSNDNSSHQHPDKE